LKQTNEFFGASITGVPFTFPFVLFVSFVVIKLHPDQIHLYRHLIPRAALEHAPSFLLVDPAPLLEKEWNPGPQALIAEFRHPDPLQRARPGTGFTILSGED
jgi:hypothetical protein